MAELSNIEQEWDPATGGIVTRGPKLHSSWKRGGSEGAWDFKFEYEGATIFCRYPRDFSEIQAEQDAIVEAATEIEKQEAQVLQNRGDKTDAQLKPELDALKELADGLALRSARFAFNVVQKCVVGWQGAPLPFSEANRAELPLRMMNDWFLPIIENSRLSKVEADFLASS